MADTVYNGTLEPNDRLNDSSQGETGFATALAMIAGLPLSDAEKTEAVRRLLAQAADAAGGEGGGV